MQDPAKEIEDVVRGLVEKPTLERQAAVLRRYFTEDVEFTHYYINTRSGVNDLISIYQMAELMLCYQSAEIQKIVYDRHANALTIRMTVYIRPLGILPLSSLKVLTLLELEDHNIEGGRTVKKIKVQRDYFQRSPFWSFFPLLGRIYDSDRLRTLLGTLEATTFDILKQGFYVIYAFYSGDQSLKTY